MITRPLYTQIVNCETGEEIVREFTEEEYAQAETDLIEYQAQEAARLAEEQTKAETKASGIAKLLALGLTEAEANALGK